MLSPLETQGGASTVAESISAIRSVTGGGGSSAIGTAILSTIAAAAGARGGGGGSGDGSRHFSGAASRTGGTTPSRHSGRHGASRIAFDSLETASSTFSPSKRSAGQRRNLLDEVKGKAAEAAKGIITNLAHAQHQHQHGGGSSASQHGGAHGPGSAIKTAVAQMASVAMSAAASVGDAEEDGPLTTTRRNQRSNRVRERYHSACAFENTPRSCGKK